MSRGQTPAAPGTCRAARGIVSHGRRCGATGGTRRPAAGVKGGLGRNTVLLPSHSPLLLLFGALSEVCNFEMVQEIVSLVLYHNPSGSFIHALLFISYRALR